MTKNMMRLGLASMLVLAGLVVSASAQTTTFMSKRTKVDFDFYAGKKLMPAGEYIVKLSPAGSQHKLVVLQQIDGDAYTTVPTVPGVNKTNLPPGSVTFNRYGNQHYLAGVQLGDAEVLHQVIKTKEERLIAQAAGKKKDTAQLTRVKSQNSGN